MAAVGILAAVIARQQTGRGQLVDISMLDGAVMWNVYHLLIHWLGRAPAARHGAAHRALCRVTPSTRRATRRYRHRRRLRAALLGDAVPALRPRRLHRPGRWAEDAPRGDFAFFRAAFRQKTLAEWMAELGDKEICFGPVNTIDEAYADPQLRHRGMVVDTEHAGRPPSYSATPIKLSETPPALRTSPPRARPAHRRGAARARLCGQQIAALHEQGVIG